jgi:hypothetical protein
MGFRRNDKAGPEPASEGEGDGLLRTFGSFEAGGRVLERSLNGSASKSRH